MIRYPITPIHPPIPAFGAASDSPDTAEYTWRHHAAKFMTALWAALFGDP